jgi:hypothetical protein
LNHGAQNKCILAITWKFFLKKHTFSPPRKWTQQNQKRLDVIRIYLSLCETCQLMKKKEVKGKPIKTKSFNGRAQSLL